MFSPSRERGVGENGGEAEENMAVGNCWLVVRVQEIPLSP